MDSCSVGMMMVSWIEEGQGHRLYYEVWTQSCPGMSCSGTYVHSVNWRRPLSLHGYYYYLWERRRTHCCHWYQANNLLSLSTSLLFGQSSLSYILLAPWKMVLWLLTAVGWWWARLWWLVLESDDVDKHNMVLPSLWGTSCTVEQWWQKAHTLNTRFEHQLLCPLLWSILNMYLHTSQKCWEWRFDDLDNKQDVQGAIAIKWVHLNKWPTYYSSHYCIDAMKQYRCVAKIQITLYYNMA